MRGDKFSEHRHRCPSCRLVWQHNPNDCMTQDQHDAAHTCPTCGTEQRQIFYGEAAALCRHSGYCTEWKAQPLPPHLPGDSEDKEFEHALEVLDEDQMAEYMAKQFCAMPSHQQQFAMHLMEPFKDTPGHPAQKVYAKLSDMTKKKLDKLPSESVGLWK